MTQSSMKLQSLREIREGNESESHHSEESDTNVLEKSQCFSARMSFYQHDMKLISEFVINDFYR